MIDNIQVGKFTLESLTTGMYSDPKIIYREYIQNSVDSLETAIAMNIIKKEDMRIDITVDEDNSRIVISDNGTGIPKNQAVSTLLNIGSSTKRHSNNRGFRGIGRLGGMSYCDLLIFSTSAINESVKTIISFDCKKLRKLLVPDTNEDMDLTTVLESVTTVEIMDELSDSHYFSVELIDVSGFSDLLNIEIVKNYISQVAPLPYKLRQFLYADVLKDFLIENKYEIEEFPIYIGSNSLDMQFIYKPNRHRFHSDRNKRKNDEIISMNYFRVVIEGELYALGWYGNCKWLGSISESEISGLRVRKGNILIGDNRTLNNIFKEGRFNGWTQGELFIITDKLIPNARRDDFEQNEAYSKFIPALQNQIGNEITKLIREASQLRNDPSAKVINEVNNQVNEAKLIVEEGFNSTKDKTQLLDDLSQAEQTLRKTKIKEEFSQQKEELQQQLAETISSVENSNNFKINQINTSVDRKSRKILMIVSEILSEKLAKPFVDQIIEEIIAVINRK